MGSADQSAGPSAEGDATNAAARHFDGDDHAGGAGGDDEGESFFGEPEGEPFDEAAAHAADAFGVGAAFGEVIAASSDPWLGCGPFFIGGGGGVDAWQVATADGGVFGDIAEDVDELEAFAEADAAFDQFIERGFGERGHFESAEPGPELADAAGDLVGVEVQFLGGGDAGAGHVVALAADDGFEGLADQGALNFWHGPVPSEDFAKPVQEGGFTGGEPVFSILDDGQTAVDHAQAGALAGEGGSGRFEGGQTVDDLEAAAVGEGVGGAGQQIGKRQRSAHRGGQSAQAEVK